MWGERIALKMESGVLEGEENKGEKQVGSRIIMGEGMEEGEDSTFLS